MNRSALRTSIVSLLAVALALAACGGDASSTASPTSQPPSPSAAPTEGATPEPTPTPTPSPSASPTATASPSPTSATGGGFIVAPNAEADRLFLDRDDCENRTDGYRLEFPEDWWTNTEIGKWPPCVWFSPTYYTVDRLDTVPDEIAITIEWIPDGWASLEESVRVEEVLVGGQPAVRAEYRGAEGDGGTMPRDWHVYVYVIQLGPTPEGGPNLVARTATDMGGEYELNKAVLDRIMATVVFIGSVQ